MLMFTRLTSMAARDELEEGDTGGEEGDTGGQEGLRDRGQLSR